MKVAKLLAGALVATIAIGAAAAGAQDSVLRVGIITDMSGQYSDGNGSGSVIAAQMAAEEIGGTVAGRKIAIISGDHQNKADIASAIVREWIDTKHVDVVAEGVNSAVALAVMNVTRERNKPFLISGAGSSDITGKYCTPTSIQWTYDTYASSNATAKQNLVLPHRRLLIRPRAGARRQQSGDRSGRQGARFGPPSVQYVGHVVFPVAGAGRQTRYRRTGQCRLGFPQRRGAGR
jgi:hypothetical protein